MADIIVLTRGEMGEGIAHIGFWDAMPSVPQLMEAVGCDEKAAQELANTGCLDHSWCDYWLFPETLEKGNG